MIDELAKAVFMADAEGHPLTQWDDLNDEIKEHVRRIARAVLARLREPTEKMIDVGANILDNTGNHHGWWPGTIERYSATDDRIAKEAFGQILFEIFRAMIDAAGQ